jgi:hypothetical protein
MTFRVSPHPPCEASTLAPEAEPSLPVIPLPKHYTELDFDYWIACREQELPQDNEEAPPHPEVSLPATNTAPNLIQIPRTMGHLKRNRIMYHLSRLAQQRLGTYDENDPHGAIPGWGDCIDWYQDQYPQERRTVDTSSEEIMRNGDAPLSDWAEYWNQDILPRTLPSYRKPAHTPDEGLIRLEGIPQINDLEGLERVLQKEETAYFCITGLKTARTGEQSNFRVPGMELLTPECKIINTLLLGELYTGRAISTADLARWNGYTEEKIVTIITKLMPILNLDCRQPLIQTAGRNKYRLNPDAVIVDYRDNAPEYPSRRQL